MILFCLAETSLSILYPVDRHGDLPVSSFSTLYMSANATGGACLSHTLSCTLLAIAVTILRGLKRRDSTISKFRAPVMTMVLPCSMAR